MCDSIGHDRPPFPELAGDARVSNFLRGAWFGLTPARKDGEIFAGDGGVRFIFDSWCDGGRETTLRSQHATPGTAHA